MKVQIQAQLKEAIKARKQTVMDTLRSLLTAIQYEEISQKVEALSDDKIISIVQSELKKIKEEREYVEQANKTEDLLRLDASAEVLQALLPQQLSADDIQSFFSAFKTQNAGANLGLAMKALKEKHPSQYDGKLASEIAKKVFG